MNTHKINFHTSAEYLKKIFLKDIFDHSDEIAFTFNIFDLFSIIKYFFNASLILKN